MEGCRLATGLQRWTALGLGSVWPGLVFSVRRGPL